MDTAAARRPRRWLQGLVALGCLLGGTVAYRALSAMREEPPRVEREPTRTVVAVLAARRGPWEEWITGYGRARALRSAEVAAEVSGRVVWISDSLEAGRSVAQGQELVRLEEREYAQAVREAEARLEAAQAAERRRLEEIRGLEARLNAASEQREAAARELAAIERLLEDGSVEERRRDEKVRLVASLDGVLADLSQRLEEARVQLDADRAEIAARNAALERARLDLERTVIRAPWRGAIVARDVSPGDWVTPGTRLFELVDPYRVEVPIELPASHYGEVRPGAAVVVRPVGSGDEARAGRIERVAPLVAAESRTFEAYVVLDGPEEGPLVPPGAFVRCDVAGRRWDSVVAVPRSAFVGESLYVLAPESEGSDRGVARRVEPRVVRRLPDVALVTTGLEDGALVVVTNLEKVADGTRLLRGATLDLAALIAGSPAIGESR